MTQTVDFRFELLFLLLVALTLVALVATAVLALARRGPASLRLLKALGIGWACYLAVVLLVAAATPQHVVPANHDLCFDDMCFAVVSAQTASQLGTANQPARAHGLFRIVTVRVSNRARGRTMAELGLRALLWSPQRTYAVSPQTQAAWNSMHPENAELTARLAPGQSALSSQVFDMPALDKDSGVVLTDGFTPGYFVIGECPLLHKPTILLLPPEKP